MTSDEAALRTFNNAFDLIFKACEPHKVSARRLDMQLAVEQAIVSYNPDFLEAQEILDALLGALKSRYRADYLIVVEEEAAALRIALGEAEPYQPSKEDLAYDASVQRELDGETA